VYFDSLQELIEMGGHGLYVWLAYGATLVVLLTIYVVTFLSQRNVEKSIRWTIFSDHERASRLTMLQQDNDES
jgi:heme exporter protein D